MLKYVDAITKLSFIRDREECYDAAPAAVGVFEAGEHCGSPAARTLRYSEVAVSEHKILAPPFIDQDLHERFNLLRTKIVAETRGSGDRTLLITSTQNQEGKTFIAINLAITFAREFDHTVLLIDSNVKNPSVLKYLGIDEQPGLLDCLHDNIPLSDLLICPGIEQLLLLPLGRRSLKSEALLRSRKMREMLQEMKSRRKDLYIILDGPALSDGDDAIIMSAFIDRTLFVAEHGIVKQHKAAKALGHLDNNKILGAVFNKRVV